jgi:hypothetical protein
MITNYSKPQLLIRQILERIQIAENIGLNAMVVGPQYDLHRIANTEEFEAMNGAPTTIPTSDLDDSLLVPFEKFNTMSSIEEDSVKLYARDTEAVLVKYGFCSGSENDLDTEDDAQYTGGVSFSILNTSSPNKIAATDINGNPIVLATDSDNPTLHSSLKGRPVKQNDIIYVTYKGVRTRRRVYSLEQAIIAPETNEVKNSTANPSITFGSTNAVVSSNVVGVAVSGTFNPSNADLQSYLTNGVKYNGEFSERFTIRVTTPTGKGSGGLGRVTISSSSGKYYKQGVAIAGEAGVTDFTIQDSDFLPGLVITVGNDVNGGDGLFLGDTVSATVLLDYAQLEPANFKVAGKYAYDQNDNLLIEVVGTSTNLSDPYAGAKLRITDTAGRMRPTDVTLTKDTTADASNYVVLDNTGLSIRFQNLGSDLATYQKGLRVGDVYSLDLDVGSAGGPQSVICLNGIAGNTAGRTNNEEDLEIECVEMRVEYDGFVPREGANNYVQWVAQTDRIDDITRDPKEDFGVTVNPNPRIQQLDRGAGFEWIKLVKSDVGRLYVEYKAFVPAFENENIGFSSDDEIDALPYGGVYAKFGKVDIDNPLAFGISKCLSGAQGRGIYIARVESDDLEGFTKALEKAEKNSNIYSLVALTEDFDIQLAFMNHVERMSTDEVKRWRRAYVGTDTPGIYKKIGEDPVNQKRPLATVTEYLGANTRVVDEKGTFKRDEIRPGDLFRTNFSLTATGSAIYDEYVVAAVVDEDEIILKTGPDTGYEVGKEYEIWKPDTIENVIDYVTDRSKRFGSRRLINVWVDNPLIDTELA